MTTGLTIKHVADASGFTTATLRYYEHIGLVPEPSRTRAGYRLYDQRTLDRLAFIARAKRLGCSLGEIAALTTAWDGGRCGPIQDQLRDLVATKIAAAEQQTAELATLTRELRQASAALERHRPDGACDSQCGCVSDPNTTLAPTARAVAMSAKPVTADEPAIACRLSTGSMQRRIDEWHAVLAHVERREPIDDGIRALFASSVPTGELMRLVVAEQACCQFFRFAITIDADGVALEVRAPSEAASIIESMFGTAR